MRHARLDCWLLAFALIGSVARAQNLGELELRITDGTNGPLVSARMHLLDARGKPAFPRGDVIRNHDHFLVPGRMVLQLRPGRYQFVLERGPEYRSRTGYFELERKDRDSKTVVMERFVNLKQEGWWSGELHIHRPPDEIQQWMLSEDLHFAPVITWWNDANLWRDQPAPASLMTRFDGNRFYRVMAGEDERGGGALLYFGLDQPLALSGAQRESPSPVEFLKQAKKQGAHVDIEKPFWRDVPIWLASGLVDSMGLAHNHMQRDGVLSNEAWGTPRDPQRFPGTHGNGRWTEHIYHHALSTGLRIPPSAGSACGVLPNPVGYNRVYVQLEGEPDWDAWWKGLRDGRVFVTNGPLLRVQVQGRPPGHVFRGDAGATLHLQPVANLATAEKIDYLEIVRDGEVAHEVRLAEYAAKRGRLPELSFDRSGWFLIRAQTRNPKTYRFASTGPFYVEIGETPRISKASAKFFLDWAEQRAASIQVGDSDRDRVMLYHRAAIRFWRRKWEAANAE